MFHKLRGRTFDEFRIDEEIFTGDIAVPPWLWTKLGESSKSLLVQPCNSRQKQEAKDGGCS